MGQYHIVVLLGSRWANLEDQATRWREVLVRWVADHDDLAVTLVDWPAWSPRAALPGARPLVTDAPSWLDGARLVAARAPLALRPTPLDGMGWSRLAGALRAAVDDPIDLAVSAHPLWNPLLTRLGADRTAFDAVDDWRGHPLAARAGARIDRGYRAARDATVVTANSAPLAARLAADYQLDATTVPNGVSLDAFTHPGAAPSGLPAVPFAVYVGVVQERVDIELLLALAGDGIPLVVAGPAPPEIAAVLERAGATVLGPVPYREVPGLLCRAAVGLVPHRVNELTTSMDPMKVLEYLAAGLPVVSTPLPGMDALSPRVVVAEDRAAFVAGARAAMSTGRLDGPDPAVMTREWQTVADRLLALHTGEER